MKSKKESAVIAVSWALVAACMGIIFFLSAQNSDDSKALSDGFAFLLHLPPHIAHALREAAHFTEFAGLSVLFFNAFYRTFGYYRPILSFLMTAVYAASDEIHQIFVDGRVCSVADFLVDCSGAATGIAVLYVLILFVSKLKSRRG